MLVYQEQVMMAARIIAGYTLGEADILRRAMGKKKPEVMAQQKAIFISKAEKFNNMPAKEAEDIFAVLEKFAQYGFNKSHSAAYAMLSYRTAYLKANYPVEFMAALLSSELGNMDKVSKFIESAEAINIKVLGPDINVSRENFTPIVDPDWKPDIDGDMFEKSAGSIRFGLAAIKGIGGIAAEAIVKERDANGNFKDIYDFVSRMGSKTLNKRVFENLIKTGAFDSFNIDRGHLLNSIEAILMESAEAEADAITGQQNLFDMLEMDDGKSMAGNAIDTSKPVMPLAEKLFAEKELLSFYVSGHPMNEYAGFDNALDDIPPADAVKRLKRLPFRACGVVSNVVKKLTKKDNKPWCYFTLSGRDNSKVWSINLFPAAYDEYFPQVRDGECVCVIGECQSKDGSELRFNGESVQSMTSAVSTYCDGIEWLIEADDRASRFVKILSHGVYEDAKGDDIAHKIKIKVSDRDYVEMSSERIMRTAFSPALFKRLGGEPALVKSSFKAKPIPVRERKWGGGDGFRRGGN